MKKFHSGQSKEFVRPREVDSESSKHNETSQQNYSDVDLPALRPCVRAKERIWIYLNRRNSRDMLPTPSQEKQTEQRGRARTCRNVPAKEPLFQAAAWPLSSECLRNRDLSDCVIGFCSERKPSSFVIILWLPNERYLAHTRMSYL